MAGCLFCKIATKEIQGTIVHEDEQTIAFRDINPQAPTHILIIPKRHIEKHADLGAADRGLMEVLHSVAQQIARREKLTDYRLVMNNGAQAGQSVWHLHLHLLAGRNFSWPPG